MPRQTIFSATPDGRSIKKDLPTTIPPAPREGMVNRTWYAQDDTMHMDLPSQALSAQKTLLSPNDTVKDHIIYQPPTSGILSYLPTPWVPYGELIRLNEPVGVLYFYYPFAFGTLLAACLLKSFISPSTLFGINSILLAAAFASRSAACSWIDNINADYDHQVTRCQLRPMGRCALTSAKAYITSATLFAIWLGLMYTLPGLETRQLVSYVVCLMLYPYSKRYTFFAPMFLGVTTAIGVMIGASVMGVDTIALGAEGTPNDIVNDMIAIVLCLWFASITWTVMVEIVQEFQGLKDDLAAGVTSLPTAHHHHVKGILSSLAMCQLVFLYMTGALMGAGPSYFVGACGGSVVALTWMVWSLDVESPQSCAWWYRNGHWSVGGSIAGGLGAEYLSRRYGVLG